MKQRTNKCTLVGESLPSCFRNGYFSANGEFNGIKYCCEGGLYPQEFYENDCDTCKWYLRCELNENCNSWFNSPEQAYERIKEKIKKYNDGWLPTINTTNVYELWFSKDENRLTVIGSGVLETSVPIELFLRSEPTRRWLDEIENDWLIWKGVLSNEKR